MKKVETNFGAVNAAKTSRTTAEQIGLRQEAEGTSGGSDGRRRYRDGSAAVHGWPGPEDVQAYMRNGEAPVDLIDPISHEILRGPVRMRQDGIAYGQNNLINWFVVRGGEPVDLITGLRPSQAEALPAKDLSSRIDRLREAAERVWLAQGDTQHAFATRWLRVYCRALEKRSLALTGAGIAIADAVRDAHLSSAAAEKISRSGRSPLRFLYLLNETKSRAVVRRDRMVIIDAQGRA